LEHIAVLMDHFFDVFIPKNANLLFRMNKDSQLFIANTRFEFFVFFTEIAYRIETLPLDTHEMLSFRYTLSFSS
jgi:hypothetical protein